MEEIRFHMFYQFFTFLGVEFYKNYIKYLDKKEILREKKISYVTRFFFLHFKSNLSVVKKKKKKKKYYF
jgi:hypothetical protein